MMLLLMYTVAFIRKVSLSVILEDWQRFNMSPNAV